MTMPARSRTGAPADAEAPLTAASANGPVGPRVARLEDDLASCRSTAERDALVEQFWRNAEAEATPLVDLATDPAKRWVTFLWRRGVDDRGLTGPTEPVLVLGGPALWWELASNVLRPLPGTDVLFRSYLVKADMRGRYILSPGDPLTELPAAGTPESVRRMAGFRTDPRNREPWAPLTDVADPLSSPVRYSTFALPEATPRSWATRRPGIPRGTVDVHEVASAILGNTRRVWTYSPPPSPVPSGPTPLLVVLDGWDWISAVPLATTVDNLIADGLLPPISMVLPESLDTATRYRELTVVPAFTRFLTDELLPWAGERLPVPDDPSRIALHGKSFGGLAAMLAGCTRPHVFGTVISQSGSFWWSGWDPDRLGRGVMVEQVRNLRRGDGAERLRVSLDIGEHEGEAMLRSHDQMVGALQEKGLALRTHRFNGGHDLNCWVSELPAALRWWVEPLR